MSSRISEGSRSSPDGSYTVNNGGLQTQIRRALLRTVVSLAIVICVVGFVGVAFQVELHAAANWVFHKMGIWGLTGVLLLSETVISPLAPDLFLVIVANSELHSRWWVVVPMMGLVSSLGGNLGWAIAFALGETSLFRVLVGRFRERHRMLVSRYGRWAIALAALTPLPYSVTCWTAGILEMKWRDLAGATLLRVPRFLVYYVAIAHSEDVIGLLVRTPL